MTFFDEMIKVRLREADRKRIIRQINKNPERFGNLSHFVRVAILRLLRELETGAKQ